MAEHRWHEALGGSLANRFPLVCANCLMRSDSPEAEEPCDQLVLPPAEREGGGQR